MQGRAGQVRKCKVSDDFDAFTALRVGEKAGIELRHG